MATKPRHARGAGLARAARARLVRRGARRAGLRLVVTIGVVAVAGVLLPSATALTGSDRPTTDAVTASMGKTPLPSLASGAHIAVLGASHVRGLPPAVAARAPLVAPEPTEEPTEEADADGDGTSGGSPGAGTGAVGVPPGTSLTVHEGDLTITTPGTVVDSLDVRGFVRVKAANVVIRNSIIRGPGSPLTSAMSLVQADAGANGNLLIENSEIFADQPSQWVDGIVGMGFTLRGVDIHTVVDQVKIIGDNVSVENSFLHGNLHYGTTHDDNVQVSIGSNVRVVNSTLSGSSNAGVMITQDRGPVVGFNFRANTADNGACTINVAEKSYGPPPGLSITENVFGVGQRLSRCAILMSDSTQDAATVSQNVFTDGSAVSVSRGT
jgi:hypothetical protein